MSKNWNIFLCSLISSYYVYASTCDQTPWCDAASLANSKFLIHKSNFFSIFSYNFWKGFYDTHCESLQALVKARMYVTLSLYIACFHPGVYWLHAVFLLYLFTGVSISQIVDIGTQGINGDLYMRFGSNIESQSAFYTDSNSFNMLERHSHYLSENMPISSNYYPITSAVYIEESRRRLTLLTAQPAGE